MSGSLTLFVINGSSSDAVLAFGAHLGLKFDVRERRNNQDALNKINSAQTVPTIVDHDGFVLTETSAILNHLARTKAPELLGRGNEERARNEELLSLLSSTVTHAYLLRFRPDKSADGDEARAAIKTKSAEALDNVLDQLENQIPAKGYAVGAHLVTADFLFFVLLNWAQRIDVNLLRNRPGLASYFQRLTSLPFHAQAFASDAA